MLSHTEPWTVGPPQQACSAQCIYQFCRLEPTYIYIFEDLCSPVKMPLHLNTEHMSVLCESNFTTTTAYNATAKVNARVQPHPHELEPPQ